MVNIDECAFGFEPNENGNLVLELKVNGEDVGLELTPLDISRMYRITKIWEREKKLKKLGGKL